MALIGAEGVVVDNGEERVVEEGKRRAEQRGLEPRETSQLCSEVEVEALWAVERQSQAHQEHAPSTNSEKRLGEK